MELDEAVFSSAIGSGVVRSEVYEGHGVRFARPADCAIEVDADSERATVDVRRSDGPAFAVVLTDRTRSKPKFMVETALAVLREEYPGLNASPANEPLAGYDAKGYDIEFFSLDMVITTIIRCFRTPRRTVFFMGQCSDLEGADGDQFIEDLLASLEELDED